MCINKFIDNLITEDILIFLNKIPDNSIDLGLTSPPYNKQEKNKGGLVDKIMYDNHKDSMNEEEYQLWQLNVLNELFRVIKPGGSFFYNHRVRYENGGMIHPLEWLSKTKWKLRQEIIWNRSIAGNIRGWRFWPIEERIYWLYKPLSESDKGKELESRHALLTSIWNIRPEIRNQEHPAPFPIELPTRIIFSIFSEETNKIIIDPFGGSGTTALAAKLLNHHYISVDISKQYTEISRNRLYNIEKYRNLVEKEKVSHFVKMTYKERKNKCE
ncbi:MULTISPECIES: site-specific DNA-methyltransferase [unclassified Spiroplasma]|uniref:DNA-methyltransferase n=1 Tax=unclassified Spiroplasma TaxID=2637901 RepID=UPI00313B7025